MKRTLFGIESLNVVLKQRYCVNSLLAFHLLVLGKVVQKLLSREVGQRLGKDVLLILEELVYCFLLWRRLVNIRSQCNHHMQLLVKEVRL